MEGIALLLGAGFSKAISHRMPILKELGAWLAETPTGQRLPEGRRNWLKEDPEAILTSLAQDMPWKSSIQAREDEALFLELTREIQEIIVQAETQALDDGISEWAWTLPGVLAREEVSVVTLNYDTLLEQLATGRRSRDARTPDMLNIGSLYQAPLLRLDQRLSPISTGFLPEKAFHLMKLHGSVNWYYSGREAPIGDQLYYAHDSPFTSRPDTNVQKRWAMMDKEVLIIPPVTDKTFHYQNGTVRAIWRDALQSLRDADVIYCIGYSLPITDAAMLALLREWRSPKGYCVYCRYMHRSRCRGSPRSLPPCLPTKKPGH